MNEPNNGATKRLYRIRDGRVVAGVCAGLAAYFGVDPTLVRLAFVLLTIFGGLGILLYLGAWVIIPDEVDGASHRRHHDQQAAVLGPRGPGLLGRGQVAVQLSPAHCEHGGRGHADQAGQADGERGADRLRRRPASQDAGPLDGVQAGLRQAGRPGPGHRSQGLHEGRGGGELVRASRAGQSP
jgi:phage shock protein C